MEIVKMSKLECTLGVIFFIFGILSIYMPIAAVIWVMNDYGFIDIKTLASYQNYRV